MILSMVLWWREILESLPKYRWHFAHEIQFFLSEKEKCIAFEETIEFDYESGVSNTLNHIFGKRFKQNLMLKANNEKKIIAKHSPSNMSLYTHTPLPLRDEHLSQLFDNTTREGFNFCPRQRVERFVRFFSSVSAYNSTQTWLMLLNNVELLLLPHLKMHGFPVPETYAICGFTIFQEYVGSTLQHFYDADFRLKARIAKQILEAAWKFTYGFESFRIYITDLTADNLVYNEQKHQLYFIDLDTVTVVDASGIETDSFHRQEYIECNDCFLFSDKKLCEHNLSDINFFATCLFLRQNLKEQRNGGFLYPVPEEILKSFPELETLLDVCVGKTYERSVESGEKQRVEAVSRLIDIFAQILIK